MKNISYGIGLDYLSNWGLKEALREIYQNFIDYGDYTEVKNRKGNNVEVIIKNDYTPNKLEFLRIGNSIKSGSSNIGKHGEGLKMALLIFLRNKLPIQIKTPKNLIVPKVLKDDLLGDCFSLDIEDSINDGFEISFLCNQQLFKEFRNNIIQDSDIIFNYKGYGSIVNKFPGNIYSGGLFVCQLSGFSKAYDILPENMELDRDRCVPKSFDVTYYSSKINEKQGDWGIDDLGKNDTDYINTVPDKLLDKIEPKIIGNGIQFTSKNNDGETVIINNNSLRDSLFSEDRFKDDITKLTELLNKNKSTLDLVKKFKYNHVSGLEMENDINIIISRLK